MSENIAQIILLKLDRIDGRLDLYRKLDEAQKPCQEMEMISIQVKLHESAIKDLKQKVS